MIKLSKYDDNTMTKLDSVSLSLTEIYAIERLIEQEIENGNDNKHYQILLNKLWFIK